MSSFHSFEVVGRGKLISCKRVEYTVTVISLCSNGKANNNNCLVFQYFLSRPKQLLLFDFASVTNPVYGH